MKNKNEETSIKDLELSVRELQIKVSDITDNSIKQEKRMGNYVNIFIFLVIPLCSYLINFIFSGQVNNAIKKIEKNNTQVINELKNNNEIHNKKLNSTLVLFKNDMQGEIIDSKNFLFNSLNKNELKNDNHFDALNKEINLLNTINNIIILNEENRNISIKELQTTTDQTIDYFKKTEMRASQLSINS